MNMKDITTRIQFVSISILPFGIALVIVALLFGCQRTKGPEQEKQTFITTDNIQTAYKKSITHQHMYSRFVVQAEKERLNVIANMYRAMARSEEIHAGNHAQLLRQQGIEPVTFTPESITVGKTLQTLKMALNMEELEGESMYPNLIRTAEAEQLNDAVVQFQQTQEADLRHKELIQEAFDKSGKISKTDYFVCSHCGYIMTSGKTDECPVCKSLKTTFVKI